ncbi:hypothetical protein [Rossellomorea marisflavi]|uniref:hypothetical protein n=1 Tax=Rossellomorea marisflavi TaxID=189381 RepID=UPI00345787BF
MTAHKNTFKSKDNIIYELTIDKDIITLNKGQVELLGERIEEMTSKEIEGAGVPINAVTDRQVYTVLKLLDEILKDYDTPTEILDDEIIDFTQHALERMSDEEVCIKRDWSYGEVDQEVAMCLKRAYNMDQIRIRFDEETKESKKHFGFRIQGNKRDDSYNILEAQVAVYFEDDPVDNSKTIMVITILETEDRLKGKTS